MSKTASPKHELLAPAALLRGPAASSLAQV
jgi:hypothetical protein